jgi:hypothetical protein
VRRKWDDYVKWSLERCRVKVWTTFSCPRTASESGPLKTVIFLRSHGGEFLDCICNYQLSSDGSSYDKHACISLFI